MQAICQDYVNQGVQVMAVGYQEDLDTCAIWKNLFSLTHLVLSDMSGSVSASYIPVQGEHLYFPHNAIVDDGQIVRYTATGFSETNIRNMLNSLMDPQIALDTDHLEFGPVTQGYSANRTFTVYNDGTGIVGVSNIVSSNASFSANPTTGQTYAYDDSLIVTVTFLPTHAGSYTDSLQIISSGGNAVVTVSGTADALVMNSVNVMKIGNHIALSWNAIPSADGYYVYAADNPDVPIQPANRLGYTTNTNYLDVNVLSQSWRFARYYRVTAVFLQ